MVVVRPHTLGLMMWSKCFHRLFKCIYKRDTRLCVVRVSDIHCGWLVLYILPLKLLTSVAGAPSHLTRGPVTLSNEVCGRDHFGICSSSTLGKPQVALADECYAVALWVGCQEFVA